MESQDKFYETFKKAAENSEKKEFPAMDKVWNRVEEKLDRKVLKQENKSWKKLAIAASLLLMMVLGYNFLNQNSYKEMAVPENKMMEMESVVVSEDIVSEEKAVEEISPVVEHREEILKNQLEEQEIVATVEEAPAMKTEAIQPLPVIVKEKEPAKNHAFAKRSFDAIGVKSEDKIVEEVVVADEIQETKQPPLVVIDGKVSKDKKYANGLMPNSDYETVTYLANPLYIINGEEFSEKEVFGPNPTSPYSPLTKQNILSTTILQGEAATNAYGEKGKNGVVIITTKDKKPKKQ